MKKPIFFWEKVQYKDSLLGQVDDHAELVFSEIEALHRLVNAFCEGKIDEIEEGVQKVIILEHKADNVIRALLGRVSSDTSDLQHKEVLLQTLFELEKMAEYAESAAKLLRVGKKTIIPEEFKKIIINVNFHTLACADALRQMLEEHRNMGNAVASANRVSDIESQIDEHFIEFMGLFLQVKTLSPEHLFIKELIEMLEEISDAAENAADIYRANVCSFPQPRF